MSQKSNPAVIGAFVVGAIVLMVAAVVLFGSGKFFTPTRKFVLFFEGSVNGLNTGAPVTFRGVKIGSVTDIKILLDARDLSLKIPVFIEIDPTRITQVNAAGTKAHLEDYAYVESLIERGLRAQLGMQSLVTGQLFVDLDFYPNRPPRLVRAETDLRELPTIPSPLEELSRTLQTLPLEEIANKTMLAIEGIERFVNSPELKDILRSLDDSADEAKTLLHSLSEQVQPIAQNLAKTLEDAQQLLQNIDRQVGPLAKKIDATVQDTRSVVGNINKRIDPLLGTVQTTFETTRAALQQANQTLKDIQGTTGQGSVLHYELTKTLQSLSSAAASIRVLADYLERHPEALLRGKGR